MVYSLQQYSERVVEWCASVSLSSLLNEENTHQLAYRPRAEPHRAGSVPPNLPSWHAKGLGSGALLSRSRRVRRHCRSSLSEQGMQLATSVHRVVREYLYRRPQLRIAGLAGEESVGKSGLYDMRSSIHPRAVWKIRGDFRVPFA